MMKYLKSMNLWCTPELVTLYRKTNQHKKKIILD